jgi:hypothetical protein
MLELKQYLNRRLTLSQTAAVVVIVAVLGGLGYATYKFIAAQVFEARLRAAVPRLCVAVRQQRAALASAIEAYKTSFGVYPPDHVVRRQPLVVDPVTNTLLYELVGAVYNSTNKMLSVEWPRSVRVAVGVPTVPAPGSGGLPTQFAYCLFG